MEFLTALKAKDAKYILWSQREEPENMAKLAAQRSSSQGKHATAKQMNGTIFYEDLNEQLGKLIDASKIQRDYLLPGMENARDYPIDWRIEGKNAPLFLFGIPNRDKARLTTIILEHLLRANADFESLLIFADQGSIPKGDLARLSNVGGEMIASPDAEDDLRRKVLRRVA
ncbi:MAG: hypothetical protein WBB32_01850 [Flavobacteriales bacterium]